MTVADEHVTALIEALEATQLADATPPLDAVAAMLSERGPILEAIVDLDFEGLSPPTRQRLTRALEEARAHDARLTVALLSAQTDATTALDRLVDAGGAARGYRGGRRSKAGSVLRTA